MADDRIKRIEDKVDDIKDKVSNINVTLALNTSHLKDHMHRTELLEEQVKTQTSRIDKIFYVGLAISILFSTCVALIQSGIIHIN